MTLRPGRNRPEPGTLPPERWRSVGQSAHSWARQVIGRRNGGSGEGMAGIRLSSAAFSDHTLIPERYARKGENLSPPLTWSGVPDGTAELLLLCEDPDAPAGTFVHWLVTGIDPVDGGVDAGQTPTGGTEHPNGFGEARWGGPQPPVGDDAHRYFFRLYALPSPVDLPADANADDVHRAVDHLQLAAGILVGLFQR